MPHGTWAWKAVGSVTSGKRVNFSFRWLSRFVGDAETASLASSHSLNFLGIWEFQEDPGTGIIPASAPQGWHSLHLASLWQDQWHLPSPRFCWHVAKSPGPAICSDHSLVLFLGCRDQAIWCTVSQVPTGRGHFVTKHNTTFTGGFPMVFIYVNKLE